MKKILIIGGTGQTGRLIADYLIRTEGFKDEIILASRHPESFKKGSLSNVSATYLDINNQKESIRKVSEYDFVVLAIGPFSAYGLKPYSICIQAGVPCLDINDDYHIHKELNGLKHLAKEKHSHVYTGMGLNPGLTTLQILELVQDGTEQSKKDIDFSLFIGSKQLAGYAAVEVMLEGFGFKKVPCIINSALQEVDVLIDNDFDPIDFGNGMPAQDTFLCPSPQIWSFLKSGLVSKYGIQNLWFTIAFQSMDRKGVNFFRKNRWIQKKRIKKFVQNLMFKMQKKTYNKKGNTKETYSLVRCTDVHGTSKSLCTGLSSYEMTALFAAVMTKHLMREDSRQPGIYSFEDVDGIETEQIKKDLEFFGLTFNLITCKKEATLEYSEVEAR